MQQPVPVLTTEQAIIDREHLRLLSAFYYVTGAVHALAASVLLIYLFLGLMMVFSSSSDAQAGGFFFSALGGLGALFGWIFAGLTIYAGRCIAMRKHKLFTLIMGGFNCLSFPYGTILGVASFMVLTKQSVNEIYEEPRLLSSNVLGTKPSARTAGTLPLMPPTPGQQNPFDRSEHHHDSDEEKMWKALEEKASQSNQPPEESA